MKTIFTNTLLIFMLSFFTTTTYSQTLTSTINTVPTERNIQWNSRSSFADSIINIWAKRKVNYGKEGGKVNNPRILLAKLHQGKDIEEINEIILGMEAWGVTGSSWALNKLGDYDFTLTVLTTILYQFGDKPEILHEKTVTHLLNNLLIEEGNKVRTRAPKTIGLIPETENHILMTEGSRYLKNRWLKLHGSTDTKHDNISNGMEDKIMSLLLENKTHGLHEFNSMPYIGYTITALLNLEAYASENIRKEARAVLDYLNYSFALASLDYKYFPPMRRRYSRQTWHELTTGYHATFMKSWLSFLPNAKSNYDIGAGKAHALIAVCMPYRPADKITKLIFEKENGYFVKLGHGKNACPEIYSAGANFLLSAGGANRSQVSQIVPRTTTLFLRDNATNLVETFSVSGPSTNFMKWNNTGVYKNFACAARPVSIPKNQTPIKESEHWQIYSGGNNVLIAIYSTKKLGIMAIFNNKDPEKIIEALEKENADIKTLKTQFKFPEGSLITYNVNAPKNKWVIKSVNGKLLDRKYDQWQLIDGEKITNLK